MRAIFKVEKPDEMEFTMTLTMPLGQWKRLRDLVDGVKWPGSDFHIAIGSMVRQADASFMPKQES